jgi:hypothetical protein
MRWFSIVLGRGAGVKKSDANDNSAQGTYTSQGYAVHPIPSGGRSSPAYESEQVGVDHVDIRCAHAVRIARIYLERAVL